MIFHETKLKGAFIVEMEPREDHRGYFARAFCANEFAAHGIQPRVVQANMSGTRAQGTIRGMHYQLPPASEPKFIRCVRGAIYDVIIDMRPESPTYLQHIGVELTAENRRAIYVPDLFAHGHQALVDDVEIFYLVGEFYTPGCERGVRHDDPAVGIQWPLPVTVVSEKDMAWPWLDRAAASTEPTGQ
jgi:dTDP-4-dehydrorhamnose 3,5-epimerase